MQIYEYKIVPAPGRGEKARGLKTGVERFANTLAGVMNGLAAEGWEYIRADTLPSEERTGFTKRTTVYHTLLVFRRPKAAKEEPPRALLTSEAPAGKAPPIRRDDKAEPREPAVAKPAEKTPEAPGADDQDK